MRLLSALNFWHDGVHRKIKDDKKKYEPGETCYQEKDRCKDLCLMYGQVVSVRRIE